MEIEYIPETIKIINNNNLMKFNASKYFEK